MTIARYCPACGAGSSSGRFCSRCGLDLDDRLAADRPRAQKDTPAATARHDDYVAARPRRVRPGRKSNPTAPVPVPPTSAPEAASTHEPTAEIVAEIDTEELDRASLQWTTDHLVRNYPLGDRGRAAQAAEAALAADHGYRAYSGVEGNSEFRVLYVPTWVVRTMPFVGKQTVYASPTPVVVAQRPVPVAPAPSSKPASPAPGKWRQIRENLWKVNASLALTGLVLLVVGLVANETVAINVGTALFFGPLLVGWFVVSGQGINGQLASATSQWKALVVVREYKNDGGGRRRMQGEAAILASHGYYLAGQSGQGGHVNVGRTVAPAVLTGGLSLLFGASRSKGRTTVTFYRQ